MDTKTFSQRYAACLIPWGMYDGFSMLHMTPDVHVHMHTHTDLLPIRIWANIMYHYVITIIVAQGDNNYGDDRLLYAEGQEWLHRSHIMGRAVGCVARPRRVFTCVASSV